MLYSAGQRIGLARHPKTASNSLTAWFHATFPDAKNADVHDNHLPVPKSLRRLGLVKEPTPSPKWHGLIPKPLRPRPTKPSLVKDITVIGVVREPFEMLVSLYSYWRRTAIATPRTPGTLRYTAAHGTFRDFVVHAVVEGKLPNYSEFFGVGLPEQPSLTLIDLRSLGAGVAAICRDYGLPAPAPLAVENAAPTPHDYDRFREEVRFMIPAIRSRYRWYYEDARRLMAKSSGSLTLRPAA